MAADIQQFWQAVETATDPTVYQPARHTAVIIPWSLLYDSPLTDTETNLLVSAL